MPKVRIQFADIPYLHYSNRPRAANPGDLMRILVQIIDYHKHLSVRTTLTIFTTDRKETYTTNRGTSVLHNRPGLDITVLAGLNLNLKKSRGLQFCRKDSSFTPLPTSFANVTSYLLVLNSSKSSGILT